MTPPRPTNPTVRRALVAGGIVLATAACFVLIKAGLAFAPPFLFAALRLLLAGLALGLLLPVLGQPLLPSRSDWPWLGLLALASTAFAYGAMFSSPSLSGAGLAAVLGNVQPLILTGLTVYFLKERFTLSKALALGLGLLGILLMAWPALVSPGGLEVSGAGLALASSLGFAVGSLVIRRLEPPHLLTLTAWQLLLGSLPLFAGWLLWERGSEVRIGLEFVGLLLVLALAGTAFV
nr:DMT family transporter [Thermaceae bacterium]